MRRLDRLPTRHALLLGVAAAAIAGPVAGAGAAARQGAVPVCQATGDGAYVLVQVLPDRLTEYRASPANLVPAPAGGCPARVADAEPGVPTASTAPPTTTEATTPAAPATEATGTSADTDVDDLGSDAAKTTTAEAGTTQAPADSARVAGVSTGGSIASAPPLRPAPFTGELPASAARLPVTGSQTWLLLFLGADLLVLGAGLRLRAGSVRG